MRLTSPPSLFYQPLKWIPRRTPSGHILRRRLLPILRHSGGKSVVSVSVVLVEDCTLNGPANSRGSGSSGIWMTVSSVVWIWGSVLIRCLFHRSRRRVCGGRKARSAGRAPQCRSRSRCHSLCRCRNCLRISVGDLVRRIQIWGNVVLGHRSQLMEMELVIERMAQGFGGKLLILCHLPWIVIIFYIF